MSLFLMTFFSMLVDLTHPCGVLYLLSYRLPLAYFHIDRPSMLYLFFFRVSPELPATFNTLVAVADKERPDRAVDGLGCITHTKFRTGWQSALEADMIMIPIKRGASLQTRLLLPSTSLSLERWALHYRIMGRYSEKASTFFTGIAYCLGRKRRPPIDPLSRALGPPIPQTSLSTSPCTNSLNRMLTYSIPFVFAVFELPDELILSILSHISPDPQLTGRYARFYIPYSTGISYCCNQRADFLRPLSVTCRAMRLRLLPWVWERLEVLPRPAWKLEEQPVQKLNTVMSTLRTDTCLAIR